MRSRSTILFSILITLTVGLFLLDLAVGAVNIPIRDVWAALTGGDCPRATEKIVLNIRLIKAIVALLAGAALSVSGLQMQTLFRNPLAGPYVLGISSGASLGVALVVLAGIGSSIGIAGAAWVGAAVVLLVITAVGQRIKRHHGNPDSGHDVLIGRRCCRADIAVPQQRGIAESLCHLDDGGFG